MKKKITHPDGTVEEFEGTAEELAQLEKKLPQDGRKDESKSKGPRILLDSRVTEMARQDVGGSLRCSCHGYVQCGG